MKVRNCGWIEDPVRPLSPVWARRNVFSFECPKSAITRQSAYLLERFNSWRRFGEGVDGSVPAKMADAFLFLKNELELEEQYGKTQKQHSERKGH